MQRLTYRWFLAFFFLGLGMATAAAYLQTAPGYMDAEYYYSGGLRIANGDYTEPFLWNYLDDPKGLPNPAFTYWMPLASVLAALGIKLAGAANFGAARLPFIVIAGLIPPATGWLAFSITGKKHMALLAGGLAVVSPFYLPYLVTTETFGVTMLLGVLFLQTTASVWKSRGKGARLWPFFALGLLAGAFHLARADGLLWLFLALGVASVFSLRPAARKEAGRGVGLWAARILVVGCGYLLIMGPWMARNLVEFGTLLSPGGSRALWLTHYDELFAFPAQTLTFQHWISSGIAAIARVRWEALILNLETAIGVQGEIFLLPLILVGLWQARKDVRIRLFALAWLIIFGAMTLVFPLPGSRGGFFHSGAALQPVLWAVAPLGLEQFIQWGIRRRNWKLERSWRMFGAGVFGLILVFALVVYYQRAIGVDSANPAWEASWKTAAQLEKVLQSQGADPAQVVLVNNPPGYTTATGRPSIVIPDGNEQTLMQVIQAYHPAYLWLEVNHPAGLDALYEHPSDRDGLVYLGSFDDARLFRVAQP